MTSNGDTMDALGEGSANIKNVVFDLGGVLVRWAPSCFLKEMFGVGVEGDKTTSVSQTGHDPNDEEFQRRVRSIYGVFKTPAWVDLDRGTISRKESLAMLSSVAPEVDEELFTHFLYNVPELLTLIPQGVEILNEIKAKGKYRLYILSNYHAENIEYLKSNKANRDQVFSHMDGECISAVCKHVKPEPEIYEWLTTTYGLSPQETLFIDDMPVNIAAAEALGWHGALCDTHERLRSGLIEKGVL
eukprot:TRINITY_DN1760_c1_g1_i1.p1 TRINITY_DN1760_c1_g1~~TRINITY_DN1760_c1_g1_i1.p1  ORF type:complete len:259 (+),score=44.23 TRINITY_DN1760_c1_g1_i1:46-777(+)